MSDRVMKLAIIGAGRIAHVHAASVARDPHIKLVCVADVRADAAHELAEEYGAEVVTSDDIFHDEHIDSVLIASPTATHAEFLERAARANKAILCEKPVSLDLASTRAVVDVVKATGVTCAIGFNRRHDAQFRALKDRLDAGDIGNLESLAIISRDPAPPPIDYICGSGGLFRDMMIHDFDMARWLLGEPVESVAAFGSVLVDPRIGEQGDVDTAMVTLVTSSGRLCHIENSRRATYGYDQRIEAFGSKGMLQAVNETPTRLRVTTAAGQVDEPPQHFFLERYADAYACELSDFRDAWDNDREPAATPEDGYRALRLATAADQASKEKRVIAIAEID